MHYYYFNPFNKQYLFPKGFKHFKLFTTFYQAYTLKGKLMWWLFKNSFLLRVLSNVSKAETVVPILQLQQHITTPAIFAFNRGSIGVEQKISILGVETQTNTEFFIKYADTELARENVNNENNR